MPAPVFETMRQAALAASQRKDCNFLRSIFDQQRGHSPTLTSAEMFRHALDAAAAPCVPDSSQSAQHFARFASSIEGHVIFNDFKRAVEQPDALETWLDEESSMKLGALAPALRSAIQMHEASVGCENFADPALAPLLAFSEMDEGTLAMAIDASLEAIKKQLISRQCTLRRIFLSKALAIAKRDEFVCGQMEVGTIQDFYDGLQGRVG